jgi:hypothetical protein
MTDRPTHEMAENGTLADILEIETGAKLVRGPGAPLVRDEATGMSRLQFPDGSVSDIGNLSRLTDAARHHGLLDRSQEHVEAEDGTAWRRKASADDVLAHVKRLARAKRIQVDWNQCLGCGGRMKYRPGSGRFCGTQCRDLFDKGLDFTARAENEQLAA